MHDYLQLSKSPCGASGRPASGWVLDRSHPRMLYVSVMFAKIRTDRLGNHAHIVDLIILGNMISRYTDALL
jgi:hypothetical protein